MAESPPVCMTSVLTAPTAAHFYTDPLPLAEFKGPTSKGREGKGDGREREGREREGRGKKRDPWFLLTPPLT